ncbi:MAG: ferrochelatase [Candidatus Eremiobacter antarcticus]|nr:ferrochelatase [Candidatus Eremiobacteraeota bacterium]MBC5807644.1 ferrochelatase [Candidatus Eremiobacteraeota bacterium]PZR61308.1 MAG: ferrochelatase [Candidatus Eremiobacter sp. RRmetagenome_bin22]
MSAQSLSRTGIVLTQVGGPDDLASVKPYLKSFFSDPDLIRLPRRLKSLQGVFAWSLASVRAPYSRKLYASIGGGSPIRQQTQAQADALAAELRRRGEPRPVYVAMRHSQPNSLAAMSAAQQAGIEELVVIGLFPQYSFSTTLSGLTGLKNALSHLRYDPKLHVVEEYCDHPSYVAAVVDVTRRALRDFRTPAQDIHLIFSAHGLPLSYIEGGDPYYEHVKRSVAAVSQQLDHPGPIHTSFQSRLGPQKWLQPASDTLIEELGRGGAKAICMVPIAFVSEHVETLNEIDIQYADIAKRAGIEEFGRACAIKCHPAYIRCLADLAQQAAAG